ncbi:MAG: hypothetical protein E7231_18385 [Cellulosilyticum sp.]|nr:hypothetical protein [Cellulosilyticum sp.]
MNIIDMPYDFTSYEFFRKVLVDAKYNCDSKLIFDFSNTRRVEPLVIPNLLCLAYEIKQETGTIPQILIPDTYEGGVLRNYLNEIEFTKYALGAELYNFPYNPYGGLSGKKIDPLCGTLVFDAVSTRDEIYRGIDMCITPFAERYLEKFNSYNDNNMYINEIVEFLEEIIVNSKVHGKSFSITTLHANYSAKKIYIAISDVGGGFYSTLQNEAIDNDEKAILAGIYKRKDSKVYGLYNVIRRVLEFEGRIRIHSNDTQIIFTPRVKTEFLNERLNKVNNFRKYNVKGTVQYDGVHIEMELPLERGWRDENFR